MNFFSKSKLKVRNESTKNYAKFCIEYFNLGNSTDFKFKLFNKIFDNNMCLAIIDTNLSYLETQAEKEHLVEKITTLLENLDIEHKNLTVKPSQNLSGLKALINMKNKDKNKEYIVGFVISEENLEDIKPIIESYNAYYYINSLGLGKDELLDQLQYYYYDEDEFNQKFYHRIFDCNSIKSMVILSKTENTQSISNVIDKLKKDL